MVCDITSFRHKKSFNNNWIYDKLLNTKIYREQIMVKVYSSQFNYLWGDQIHFPYTIGMLVSYMKTKPTLK